MRVCVVRILLGAYHMLVEVRQAFRPQACEIPPDILQILVPRYAGKNKPDLTMRDKTNLASLSGIKQTRSHYTE